MIQIYINENDTSEQQEHTKVVNPPNNLQPVWKETLTFEITKPNDQVAIQIVNMNQNRREVMAERRFLIRDIEDDETLHELINQKRINDTLNISDGEQQIGSINYQATWIYNKKKFLTDLLDNMQVEKAELIDEIKMQHKKMMMICGPFGGFRNILEIDDFYFDDTFLTSE